ncbi:MAG TPA: hypothetical protein VEZ26_01645, partial [Sphingomonadaceae bacterium]|nr:hypothetical protein [Sphingomonadaceae bacterium]
MGDKLSCPVRHIGGHIAIPFVFPVVPPETAEIRAVASPRIDDDFSSAKALHICLIFSEGPVYPQEGIDSARPQALSETTPPVEPKP